MEPPVQGMIGSISGLATLTEYPFCDGQRDVGADPKA
jgi:hypothetical protein